MGSTPIAAAAAQGPLLAGPSTLGRPGLRSERGGGRRLTRGRHDDAVARGRGHLDADAAARAADMALRIQPRAQLRHQTLCLLHLWELLPTHGSACRAGEWKGACAEVEGQGTVCSWSMRNVHLGVDAGTSRDARDFGGHDEWQQQVPAKTAAARQRRQLNAAWSTDGAWLQSDIVGYLDVPSRSRERASSKNGDATFYTAKTGRVWEPVKRPHALQREAACRWSKAAPGLLAATGSGSAAKRWRRRSNKCTHRRPPADSKLRDRFRGRFVAVPKPVACS